MLEIIQQIKQGFNNTTEIDKAIEILKTNLANSELFFDHSLRTALLLKNMGADEETIALGILHHLPESTPDKVMAENIKKLRQLRDLCTPKKAPKIKPLKKWQKLVLSQEAENTRKMFFAITQDIKPIFAFLAGRLDEMQNAITSFDKEKQLTKSIVALEILSPLAYSMGMSGAKGQFEDIAFPYVYPKEYKWLLEHVKEKYVQSQAHIDQIKPEIENILKQEGIKPISVHARAKRYFSLYQKLLRHEMDIDNIYDIVALRIIVPDVSACYKTLGIIHKKWQPIYGRIKDYISAPKPNGYRSLHTTVKCPECHTNMEVQIKTPTMNYEAEFGIASHFSYKTTNNSLSQTQYYWVNQLRKWHEETKDPKIITKHLQTELFPNRIFAVTPKNEVMDLPKGSTPIDFAYAIHTDVGKHCQAAKINGKMVSLKKKLETGDIVEIITDKRKVPSSDWLRFVKTNKARVKIRSFLEKAYGISLATPGRVIKEKATAIGKILPSLPKRRKKVASQVLVGGESGIAIKMAGCCKPKTGDKITAFVTKGEGASVHKTSCKNLADLEKEQPQRIVEASWTKE